MSDIGNAIFVFGIVRLLISFVNWISRSYLPRRPRLEKYPFVSILIPARNEEASIGNLLSDLSAIKYGPLEILVYNDSSTDRTPYIVKQFAEQHNHIKLIEGTPLPDGWMGKNHACHQLVSHAQGSMILFLDADVRVRTDIIQKSLAYISKHNLKLLSIFPTQIMPSIGSRLSVPIMNWILLSLLPLPLIRLLKRPSLSAANGQFMFFDAHQYKQIMPHKHFKDNQVEDISIVKEYKRRKIKVATLLGADDIYCHMYDTLDEGVNGFSRNVFQFFGGSSLLTLFFAIVTTIAPVFLWIFNGYVWALAYIAAIALCHVFVSLASYQSVKSNLLLLIPQQFVFWRIIISAFVKQKRKNLVWKNRNISSV